MFWQTNRSFFRNSLHFTKLFNTISFKIFLFSARHNRKTKCITLFIQYIYKNCSTPVNVMTKNGFSITFIQISLFIVRYSRLFFFCSLLFIGSSCQQAIFRHSLAGLIVIIITSQSSFVYICRKDEWRVTQKMTFFSFYFVFVSFCCDSHSSINLRPRKYSDPPIRNCFTLYTMRRKKNVWFFFVKPMLLQVGRR